MYSMNNVSHCAVDTTSLIYSDSNTSHVAISVVLYKLSLHHDSTHVACGFNDLALGTVQNFPFFMYIYRMLYR